MKATLLFGLLWGLMSLVNSAPAPVEEDGPDWSPSSGSISGPMEPASSRSLWQNVAEDLKTFPEGPSVSFGTKQVGKQGNKELASSDGDRMPKTNLRNTQKKQDQNDFGKQFSKNFGNKPPFGSPTQAERRRSGPKSSRPDYHEYGNRFEHPAPASEVIHHDHEDGDRRQFHFGSSGGSSHLGGGGDEEVGEYYFEGDHDGELYEGDGDYIHNEGPPGPPGGLGGLGGFGGNFRPEIGFNKPKREVFHHGGGSHSNRPFQFQGHGGEEVHHVEDGEEYLEDDGEVFHHGGSHGGFTPSFGGNGNFGSFGSSGGDHQSGYHDSGSSNLGANQGSHGGAIPFGFGAIQEQIQSSFNFHANNPQPRPTALEGNKHHFDEGHHGDVEHFEIVEDGPYQDYHYVDHGDSHGESFNFGHHGGGHYNRKRETGSHQKGKRPSRPGRPLPIQKYGPSIERSDNPNDYEVLKESIVPEIITGQMRYPLGRTERQLMPGTSDNREIVVGTQLLVGETPDAAANPKEDSESSRNSRQVKLTWDSDNSWVPFWPKSQANAIV